MEEGIVVNVRTKVYVHNGDTFFLRVEKSFFLPQNACATGRTMVDNAIFEWASPDAHCM